MSKDIVKKWTTSCGLKAEIEYNEYLGTFLGYVFVHQTDQVYELLEEFSKHKDEPTFIDVHGGVSCFYKDPEDLSYVIGFDCGHPNDKTTLWDGEERDENFVFVECEMISYQLVHGDFDPYDHQEW